MYAASHLPTTKCDGSSYLQNIYSISSCPAFLLCGSNSCAGAFYFYDAYSPRIKAGRKKLQFKK